jgi:predicted enzyme related to lactoylglutathione lyase
VPNPIVHFEITGKDKAKLQKFYADAFNWKVDAGNPMGYGMVDNGGEGINGGIDGDAPGVMIYIAVDDPAAYLKKVAGMGCTVVQDVTVIPGMVTMAKFADPEGNVIGLVANEMPSA